MKPKVRFVAYMSEEEKKMLDDLFIQRIREGSKSKISSILCDGIKLLHEKEHSKKKSHEDAL
jgi:hypothetical protein